MLFHRLDVDTTGVVLFGEDPALNAPITEMFRSREMNKTYWAVVDGVWLDSWRSVRTFIKKAGSSRWENVPKGRGGDPGETQFRLLSTNREKSWIEAKPLTGRTHQIRLHCLERGHAILGDRLYGRANAAGIPMALHARRLEFKHPLTGRDVRVEAVAPAYWQEHWLRGLKAPSAP